VVKTSSSNARGVGSNSGQGAKIPHALGPKNQNIKRKLYCNKFNKDFKNTSSILLYSFIGQRSNMVVTELKARC